MARLHRFQGEHPEVGFTAPHMGGQGRYIAVAPPGSVPGDPREITVNSLDLAGLMDQLEEIYPPDGTAVQRDARRPGPPPPGAATPCRARARTGGLLQGDSPGQYPARRTI